MKNIHILPTSQCKGSFKDCFKSLDECVCDNMKQETLEEVAEKYAEGKSSSSVFRETHIRDFTEGAKWQQEQDKNKFSEEEVLILLTELSNDIDISYHHNFNEKEWFEQFKKK